MNGYEWEGRGGVTGRQWTWVSRRAAASVSRVSTKDLFLYYLHLPVGLLRACALGPLATSTSTSPFAICLYLCPRSLCRIIVHSSLWKSKCMPFSFLRVLWLNCFCYSDYVPLRTTATLPVPVIHH